MKEGELGRGYHDGDVIFREGEKGEMMYVIQSGKVKITREGPSGEITLGVLGGGEIFGEMALFDRLPRSATAVAAGEARILSVDRKKLFPTISRDPTLLFKILETMSQRIRRLDDEVEKLRKSQSHLAPAGTNIGETCNMLLEEARSVIAADIGSVMLVDKDGQFLSVKASFGMRAEMRMRLNAGEGIEGEVLNTGKAELINDVRTDPRSLPRTSKIASMLCVPIRCEGRTFGIITMGSTSEKRFAANDLKFLRTLAVYASIAIQNEENFSHLKNATDELLRNVALMGLR
jgi:CRP-like cAMP-binding protein